VDETAPSSKGSKPFLVFEANIYRLIALHKQNREPLDRTLAEVNEMLAAARTTLGDVSARVEAIKAKAASEGSKTISISAELKDLSESLAPLGDSVTSMAELRKSTSFLHTWMIVMLVTFAEAYIEDILLLLISDGLKGSSLPRATSEEITKKWVKNLLRGGNPHAWVKQLEKFGASHYDPELAGKMQRLWERRHSIVHTAEPEAGPASSQEFLDAMLAIKSFVDVTEPFVIGCAQGETPTSP
jgi:hypothetical protein